MKFLSIDTTRNIQSVSLFDSGSDTYIFEETYQSKSSVFVSDLLASLDKANIQAQNLHKLMVVTGPGSFTGIRTGISVIKTFAAELDLEVFTANNFELLRFERQDHGPIAINAGLNDYYISLDADYQNPQTNFFSTELGSAQLTDFKNPNISKLLIEYFLEQKPQKLLKYEALQPYYLREPSVGVKSS